ncbi:response regulator [Limnoglobus roseus]|uniref:Response regulator n=1 Tax=Limnoglobus roseus TaxID=2598579 RepID=A0A5C1A8K1_9BACT|nr:response regulator [Limnoglobus roseus]QEL13474.1 response regulator [Limnoglobus roseus]
MPGLLLSDDLIFTSRIVATARAHGLTVVTAKTAEALLAKAKDDPPAGVILDLHNPTLDVAKLRAELPGVRIVAYGSHVDVERLKAARQAGCDLVLPRSAFVDKLETDIAGWLL